MEHQGIISTSWIIVTEGLIDPDEAVVVTRFSRSDEGRVELDPVRQIYTPASVRGYEDDVTDGHEDDGTSDSDADLACSVGPGCGSNNRPLVIGGSDVQLRSA